MKNYVLGLRSADFNKSRQYLDIRSNKPVQ